MRQSKFIFDLLTVGLCGALTIMAYQPVAIWPVMFFALAPYFVILLKQKKFLHAFLLSYVYEIAFSLTAFSWVSHTAASFGGLPTPLALLVLAAFTLVAALEHVVFGVILWFTFKIFSKNRDRFKLLFILPFVFVAVDFWTPKVFPSSLGNALLGWTSLVQTAEWWSYHGLSAIVVFSNLSLAFLWMNRNKISTKKIFLAPLVFLVLVLVPLHFWGKKRITEIETLFASADKKFHIAGIQANIGDIEKLASENGITSALNEVLTTYREMTFDAAKSSKPDLIVWPETAYPYLYTHLTDPTANSSGVANDRWMLDLVKTTETPVLFGTYTHKGKKDFNSAVTLMPDGTMKDMYSKSVLLAFGEYVPLGPLSGIVQDMFPTIADFGRGVGATTVEINGVKLAPQICYEGLVPDHSRLGSKRGADILLNITNDSWFGDSFEPWLHLGLTALRPIEVRRPLVRVTNTGVSLLVSPTGKYQNVSDLFKPAILNVSVPVLKESQKPHTFFETHGEFFAYLASAISLIFSFVMSALITQKRVKFYQ